LTDTTQRSDSDVNNVRHVEKKILEYLNITADGDHEWRKAHRAPGRGGEWYVCTEVSVSEAQPHELGRYEDQVTEKRVLYHEDAHGMPNIRTIFYLEIPE
jgi:hypothetical protein